MRIIASATVLLMVAACSPAAEAPAPAAEETVTPAAAMQAAEPTPALEAPAVDPAAAPAAPVTDPAAPGYSPPQQ